MPEQTLVAGPAPASSSERGPAEAEARLVQLERLVAAQTAALARVPLNMKVPRSVLSLLACAPGQLRELELPPRSLPRVVALHGQLQALIDNITLRERELGGRLAVVRAARRAGPAPHLLDYQS